jgi:hypothetical protein
MKKTLLFALILILAACTSTSQVTPPSPALGEGSGVRETPPPTDTPAPTPTPIAVDGVATIDGIRYIFDETAQEWQALPDVPAEVARVMVTEDGRIVALDEKNAEKYSLDMATREWVEAGETMELRGVTMVLSEPDENGVKVVTGIRVDGEVADDIKARRLAIVDPESWGFEPGETQIVVEGEEVKLILSGDGETEVAKWHSFGQEWEWNWSALQNLEGGNPMLENAKAWEMRGSNEVDKEGARADSDLIAAFSKSDSSATGMGGLYNQAIYLVSADGQKG